MLTNLASLFAPFLVPFIVYVLIVGFTHIAVNFKFHSWFANFKLTSSLECVWTTRGFVTWS